jgi:hypothetical protein
MRQPSDSNWPPLRLGQWFPNTAQVWAGRGLGARTSMDLFDRVSLTSLVSKGMATMRGRSMEWPRQSRIAVGSAASHGVSIVSSKLFPSILT